MLLFNVLVNLEPTVIPASFPDNRRLNVQSAIDELQYAAVSNHGMYVYIAMLIINRLIKYYISADSLQYSPSDMNPNSSMQAFAYLEHPRHSINASNQGTYKCAIYCTYTYVYLDVPRFKRLVVT